MSEESDLRGRVETLEAQVEALLLAADTQGGPVDAASPPGEPSANPGALASITRRGLLSAAAGAVAGGAAATVANAAPDAALDTHIGDAAGAHDASAISIAPTGELAETDVRAALIALDERLASLLQFSPDYLQDYAFVYDEFFGGSTATGQVGSLGWEVVAINGGVLAAAGSPVANMPGWYQLRTGPSAPDGLCVLHHEEISLHGHPVFVWEMRVRTTRLNDGIHDATWRIGLHDDLSGVEPTNGFYFEYTGADTSLHCRTAKAGVRMGVDSGVALAAVTAYRLRIISDGGGAAYFYIDGDLVATISTDLPSAASESFGPTITIIKTAGVGESRAISVDYLYLLWAVSR